jgi:3D (Asp-Asp-Asp) domain-containing protein
MATAYCDKGVTKSGALARPGTIATDPRVLPIGSVIRITTQGNRYTGTYTVLDTGAAVKGRDVDIFIPSCAEAKKFGKRPVTALVLKRGPAPDVAIGTTGRGAPRAEKAPR